MNIESRLHRWPWKCNWGPGVNDHTLVQHVAEDLVPQLGVTSLHIAATQASKKAWRNWAAASMRWEDSMSVRLPGSSSENTSSFIPARSMADFQNCRLIALRLSGSRSASSGPRSPTIVHPFTTTLTLERGGLKPPKITTLRGKAQISIPSRGPIDVLAGASLGPLP